MLPTFVIIGAPKAGTTSLHRYLAPHPQVFMSEPKELHFFVRDRAWRYGPGWYEERFAAYRRVRHLLPARLRRVVTRLISRSIAGVGVGEWRPA